MRVVRLSVLVCAVASAIPAGAAAQEPSTNQADAVVSAAREALGGGSRISGLKSITATGRTRRVQGDNLVPIEFEIACEWPDKCYRRDEIPARESGPTTIGFNGDDLIQLPVPAAPPAPAPLPGRPPLPAPNPDAVGAARVAQTKPDFARLTLGLFLGTLPNFPVTFSYGGEAEAPQGKADIIDVKGPNNFAARVFVFRETHLPIMLTWQTPATPASPAPVDNRIYFADYRDADGLKFPYRLRRAVGAETVEETTFDRFRVNAKLDPKRFDVKK